MKRSDLLIIIPAYNESGNLHKTVGMIKEEAEEFDYVIINDCSTDDTLEICRESLYNVIDLPINLGIGGAVQTGYKYALERGYKYAVQIDGDGQHNPRYIKAMLELLRENALDMVIGSRFIEKEGFQSSLSRRIGISFLEKLIKLLTKKKITDPTSGLRLVNEKIIKLFADHYPTDYPEPETIVALLESGFTIKEIPVVMNSREHGTSSITLNRSIYYMIKVSMAMLIAKLNGGYRSYD
ncbi:glycosyltransferase family 2 protein [Streptococcus marmotae]|uniref:glycosyltransferase family 2 protein n=1 Tax=Streptococcus marmotae TaxID=1825069 RepID=UPI0008369926|nr:glycosyltransferase family 2 protein [Streptococcus marmotae]